MSKVAVIGGGASGMMAAYAAALSGHQVTLFEKNEKLGKKIFITGKGRCNLTNACDTEELFGNFVRNPKFLYSAVYAFDNFHVMDFFEQEGLSLKTERGNRVFPESDHSSDVIKTLEKALRKNKADILLDTEVSKILTKDGSVSQIEYHRRNQPDKRKMMQFDAVIVASGGASYPVTGSDGSGYRLCQELGHTIVPVRPALVPMETKESYVKELQGLSLKNVSVTIKNGTKCLFEEFGEMLFTHFGVSGPVILSASSKIPDKYYGKELSLLIDLKPALSDEQLDKRIQRDFEENKNRQFKNVWSGMLPSKMIPVFIKLTGIDPEKQINAVTKEERKACFQLLRQFPATITGYRGLSEAVITRGGISVKEVNPSTMESKLVEGLYLCGELLDLDALTGGFNLQIAWSTGYLAGNSIG